MTLNNLKARADKTRSVRNTVAMVFVLFSMVLAFVSPRDAHGQTTIIRTKSGMVVSVNVQDTGKCACDTAVVKKIVAPKPSVKSAIKPVVRAKAVSAPAKSKVSSRDSILSALQFSADSASVALKAKLAREALGVAEAKDDSVKAEDAFKGQPAPTQLVFPPSPIPSKLQLEHSGKVAVNLSGKLVVEHKRSWKGPAVIAGILGAVAAYCVYENCFGHTTNVKTAPPSKTGGPVWAPNGIRASFSVPIRQ